MKYSDIENNRLVYIGNKADPEYWDKEWLKLQKDTVYEEKIPKFNIMLNLTKNYLPIGSKIIEGGAGLASLSWYLYLSGYKTIALDYASKTIKYLQKTVPQVNPVIGDVSKLNIESESVDGYWSIGVIEHFNKGYASILNEM